MPRRWLIIGRAAIRRKLLLVTVRGSSMEPAYSDGDTLVAVRVPASYAWRTGEDLVFARPEPSLVPGDPAYLVKRLVAVGPDRLVLEGLNGASRYEVAVTRVSGRVVAVRSRAAGSR